MIFSLDLPERNSQSSNLELVFFQQGVFGIQIDDRDIGNVLGSWCIF